MSASLDSFNCRRTLKVGGRSYDYYSLKAAARGGLGDISRLPYSLKVLLENLLRHEDGRSVKARDIQAFAKWLRRRKSSHEIAYRPARVLMQDFTGVPAVVDLAAMRAAMAAMGGDPERIFISGHSAGGHLVAMMMEGAGFEVINIGINNPVENYLQAIEEHQPDILGMSALLTTTMPYMKVVIDTLKEKGLRDDYIVLVGGAPLNEAFADAIGADAYCRDAAVAVETAKELILRRHNRLGAAAAAG